MEKQLVFIDTETISDDELQMEEEYGDSIEE